jgi:hypothetical protein
MPYAYGKVCDKHPELKGGRRNSNCPACMRERKRDPEARARHRANKKPETSRVATKRWRENNPEQYRAGAHARNALRRARKKDASVDDRNIRLAFVRLSREARLIHVTVDHVVPIAGCRVCGRVGKHIPENWQLMTARENEQKGDRCMSCFEKAKTPPKRGL